MRPVRAFQVQPALPERLLPLVEIAHNLRWSWDHETISLFRRLDRNLWEEMDHNPVLMTGTLPQERLNELAADQTFLAHLDRVHRGLNDYLNSTGTWYRRQYGASELPLIAYFSMEFGITECLPIYSGGLGILAGDHLKAASDLGVPLAGVGLLYQKGYFRQHLNVDGWQQERYPVNDFSTMPIRPFRDASGALVKVTVDLAGRTLTAQLWKAQVGRVTLVLLDTHIPDNPDDLKEVTGELYGGDGERRIQQEILLGIGGMRALDALSMRARVCHMNEGHSAFLALERIRVLMKEHKLTFDEAREVNAASLVFTTHTPVPAGIDVFTAEMMERYFGSYKGDFDLPRETFLDLGRVKPGEAAEGFSTAVLAIRTAGSVNGVSRLHAKVSRAMWQNLWPGVPVNELPIGHVTNGIHGESWISDDMRNLYDRYLGPRWAEEPGDTGVWTKSHEIPGEELWRTHELRREKLVGFVRRRIQKQLRLRGAGRTELAGVDEILDGKTLTIGFARRFATYKRATLLLSDIERLKAILNSTGRPVQVIYAGKAHPRDEGGKALIRQVIQISKRPEFRRRLVFVEDYDAVVARYLLAGVDVWLNTPRRPMEASGTSGMKAAFNGALHLSILDGWWDEAYRDDVGWAIGRGEEMGDLDYQDRTEAAALYELLEKEVIPLYYQRGTDMLPHGWIDMMKRSIGALCPVYNTNRMVHEYTVNAYAPSLVRGCALEEDRFRRAKGLAAWRLRVRQNWKDVAISHVEADVPAEVKVGARFEARAWVRSGSLPPRDLAVELFFGRLDEAHEIRSGHSTPMRPQGSPTDIGQLYVGDVICTASGFTGFTVRVLPAHEDQTQRHDTGLIVWAQ